MPNPRRQAHPSLPQPIGPDVTLVTVPFDLTQIENRRFLFNATTGELVLGYTNVVTKHGLVSSHAEELAKAGVRGRYDDFIRGWIGASLDSYPDGIIHFAPEIRPAQFQDAEHAAHVLGFLERLAQHGATARTVLRNLLIMGEVPWGQTEFRRLLSPRAR